MNVQNQKNAIFANKPVIGICGYSGSGKTTLIESLVRHYSRRGLAVAVVKHDAHRLMLDTPGKDTARMYDAGASVFAHDASQMFLRCPAPDNPLRKAVRSLLSESDLVIVEGHKQTPLPVRIWLSSLSDNTVPASIGKVDANLAWDGERLSFAQKLVDALLMKSARTLPLYGGLFIGGDSTRMGSPKQMLTINGQCFVERIAGVLSLNIERLLFLGHGVVPPSMRNIPCLPDAPSHFGPLGGICAALSWMPNASWIFAPCDTPLISQTAMEWLLSIRIPGVWAVMPKQPDTGQIEPLLAWYDAKMLSVLADASSPITVAKHPKVQTPVIPRALCDAWRNINTQREMKQLEIEIKTVTQKDS